MHFRTLIVAFCLGSVAAAAWAGPVEDRAAFESKLVRPGVDPEPSLPTPPADSGVVLTAYDTDLGPMAAYATPVREDDRKRPALIWVEGGFGGIGPWTVDPAEATADNDQTVTAYLEVGRNGEDLVVFAPTFRGTAGNPGRYEMFLGEADDLVAAIEHVADRPDVDPEKVFVGGHSTGGTVALIAAALTDRPAGVLSVGGNPDLVATSRSGGYGAEPFDLGDLEESRVRSPRTYAKAVKVPVLYVEGRQDDSMAVTNPSAARRMAGAVPNDRMRVATVPGRDHFTVLRPLHEAFAELLTGDDPRLPTPAEVRAAYPDAKPDDPRDVAFLKRLDSPAAREAYADSPLQISPKAAAMVKQFAREDKPTVPADDLVVFLDFWIGEEGTTWDWAMLDHAPQGAIVTESLGVKIAVPESVAAGFGGLTLTYNDEGEWVLE